jgi:zinc transporter ZupT
MRQDGFSTGGLLAVGVAIGTAIGVAIHNTAAGIGIGLGIAATYSGFRALIRARGPRASR